MAPKHSSASTSRGPRDSAASKKASSRSQAHSHNSDVDPFADDISQQRRSGDMDVEAVEHGAETIEVDEEDEETKKTIPPELLTRILHEFFEKDGTRISKDANKAVAKYMDIFVREAIARTAVEKGNGFLEVEDLEKVAPQLLMDL
ncbi:CENP-S associating centromere protein X-domain-containing protein [Xylaria sp. FL0043]|nr:CENP-S associating centromere protein X-domain-containing protein [Xylaria sp. FL0043]